MVQILYYARLAYLLIEGCNAKGIRNRTWFAIIMSILSIAIDTTFVYCVYDHLPHTMPAMRDWDAKVLEWVPRADFFEYELQRIIILVVMLACGYVMTMIKPHSLIAKRTRCLFAETAMLIITTGVGLTMMEVSMSLEDRGMEISDYWEWTIMLFWFAISLAEYIHDYKKLKKEESGTDL